MSIQLNAGREYMLYASAEGFNTFDQNVSINNGLLRLAVSPEEKKVGQELTIEAFDNETGSKVEGLSLTLDGVSASEKFIVSAKGAHNLVVSKDGYEQVNFSFDVIESAHITSAVDKLLKGNKVMLPISENASWNVMYKTTAGAIPTTYMPEVFSDLVEFTPEDYGEYEVKINGNTVAVYSLEKSKTPFWVWYLVGGLAFIILVSVLVAFLKGGGKRVGYGYDGGYGMEHIGEIVRKV